jgi:hypothetical protein
MTIETAADSLATLVRLPDYQGQREHLSGSFASIQWFVRTHRDRLVDDGALLMLRGQWFVAPEVFDRSIRQIGADNAAAIRNRGRRGS